MTTVRTSVVRKKVGARERMEIKTDPQSIVIIAAIVGFMPVFAAFAIIGDPVLPAQHRDFQTVGFCFVYVFSWFVTWLTVKRRSRRA